MRLFYLSASRLPSTDANSVHVVKMCSAFAWLGHDVTLYGRRGDGGLEDFSYWYGDLSRFETVRLPCSDTALYGAWKYARGVRRHILAAGLPDLFYARHVHSLAQVVRFDVPMVLECHAPPASVWQRRAFDGVIRSEQLRCVVAISESLKDDLCARFPGLPESKVRVAHDGADAVSPNVVSVDLAHSRQGAVQVGYTGHLYPGKGMELIVSLASNMPDVDFHVVGGTAEDVAGWRSKARQQNLHFHGFVPHARIPSYLAAFDVVLAPYQRNVAPRGGKGDISRWMSPLKIFEYMAAGKVIIASDLPVLREVLSDRRNALLVSPDSSEAWARALREVARHPALAADLGTAALENFLSNYEWRSRAQRLLS